MPKDLTTAEIAALTKEGLTRVAHGLYIQIRGGSRTWLLRYRFRGRHQLMSIGSVRLIKLTEAKH